MFYLSYAKIILCLNSDCVLLSHQLFHSSSGFRRQHFIYFLWVVFLSLFYSFSRTITFILMFIHQFYLGPVFCYNDFIPFLLALQLFYGFRVSLNRHLPFHDAVLSLKLFYCLPLPVSDCHTLLILFCSLRRAGSMLHFYTLDPASLGRGRRWSLNINGNVWRRQTWRWLYCKSWW